MFGGVVPLYLVQDTPCLLGWERLVQRPHRMGVEVVRHQHDLLGSREVFVYHLLQLAGEVLGGALLGNRYPAPAPQRLTHHEDVGHPSSLVLVVLSGITSHLLLWAGSWREWLSAHPMTSQFLVLLVDAHLWV